MTEAEKERAAIVAHLRRQARACREAFERIREVDTDDLLAGQLVMERYRAKYIAEAYIATAEAIEEGVHLIGVKHD